MLRYFLHVFDGSPGDVHVRICLAVYGWSPLVRYGRFLCILEVHEEEELVLDDRTAESHTIGSKTVYAAASELVTVDGVSPHVLVSVIYVCGTFEGVRT